MRIISSELGGNYPVAEGTHLGQTYFEFSVDLSLDPWHPAKEVPDEELLDCMLRAGCFDYLLDPAEDIYTLGDGEPV